MLSSSDSGPDRFKLACHWLSAIKEIKLSAVPEVFHVGHNRDLTNTRNRTRKTSSVQGISATECEAIMRSFFHHFTAREDMNSIN